MAATGIGNAPAQQNIQTAGRQWRRGQILLGLLLFALVAVMLLAAFGPFPWQLLGQVVLLLAGAVINALVILFFTMAYIHRPAVMFSAGGLVTKIAQLLLEVCLLVLITIGWHHTSRRVHAG